MPQRMATERQLHHTHNFSVAKVTAYRIVAPLHTDNPPATILTVSVPKCSYLKLHCHITTTGIPTMHYTPESLEAAAKQILLSFGCDNNEATIVADHLVRANLAGHDSHGIGMLPMYGAQVKDGNLIPNQTPEMLPPAGAVCIVDAKRGFGHRMALMALDHAMQTAAKHNVAVLWLRNAGHVSRIGNYSEYCAQHGFVSIHFVNVWGHGPLVAPHGSSRAGFSTNPISIGMPVDGQAKPMLCEVAVEDEITLYLLGAAPGVAARMRENLMMTYPGLDVVGEHHGYFDHDEDSDEVIAKINASKPNIVLVAFGAPRQEKWIHNHRDKIDSNILVGVGGLFDFYSGDKKRAPLWMRKCGLEWTYRLYLEPGRLWRRYIIGNPLFVYRIMRWKKKYQRQNAGNDSA